MKTYEISTELRGVRFTCEYEMTSNREVDRLLIMIGDVDVTDIISEEVDRHILEYIYEHHEDYDHRCEPEYHQDR